jgi:glycosyltransferase involved in cell wall biosynthesis
LADAAPEPAALGAAPAEFSGPRQPAASIIVPAFNERDTIAQVIGRVHDAATAAGIDVEIVVVDDGSADGTADIVRALEPGLGVRLIQHTTNHGKGAAVKTGIAAARGRVAAIQDADLEYDPRDCMVAIGMILAGRAPAVYGSRLRIARDRGQMARMNYLANRLLTRFGNWALRTHLTDLETGCKVWTRDLFSAAAVTADRWGIDPELTGLIVAHGAVIAEIDVSYTPRDAAAGKKMRWDGFFHVVAALIACRRRGLRTPRATSARR